MKFFSEYSVEITSTIQNQQGITLYALYKFTTFLLT